MRLSLSLSFLQLPTIVTQACVEPYDLFFFSFAIAIKYDVINPNKAFKIDRESGPCFGEGDLIIAPNFQWGSASFNNLTTFASTATSSIASQAGSQSDDGGRGGLSNPIPLMENFEILGFELFGQDPDFSGCLY